MIDVVVTNVGRENDIRHLQSTIVAQRVIQVFFPRTVVANPIGADYAR